ncbi:DUF4054 domain-containing protein [Providencia rettgeri]
MSTSPFPLRKFRLLYTEFASVSDEEVLAHADDALGFFSFCCEKHGNHQWLLVVAHLLYLKNERADSESVSAIVTGVTIDKVSVSMASPSVGTNRDYWFGLSDYGKQFLAALRCSALKYYGGMGERTAFRGVGGQFPRGGRLRLR